MIEKDSQRVAFNFPDCSDRPAGMERVTYYVLDSLIHYCTRAAQARLIVIDRPSVEIIDSYRGRSGVIKSQLRDAEIVYSYR